MSDFGLDDDHGTECPRQETVDKILDLLDTFSVVQVRGTPATGKSTLARRVADELFRRERPYLFLDYFPDQDPFFDWRVFLSERLGLRRHAVEPHRILRGNYTLVLDEAQSSYWSMEFWHGFVKGIIENHGSGPRFLFFTVFGTPGVQNDSSPFANISYRQRVTLTISHQPNAPQASLFLSDAEYDDVVIRMPNRHPNPVRLDSGAKAHVAYLTAKHPGAVIAVLDLLEFVRHVPLLAEIWPLTNLEIL